MQNTRRSEPVSPSAAFQDALLNALPQLRAFAMSLCRNRERGDDLVQETMVRALANSHGFEPGSNMIAWLYTILRNQFYSDWRRRRHTVEDEGGEHLERLQIAPSQEAHIHFLNVRDACARLSTEHREALLLVASGLPYEEAAAMCGCAVGTMKSRVNRARARLVESMTVPRSIACVPPGDNASVDQDDSSIRSGLH